jgi:hypothetical protein
LLRRLSCASCPPRFNGFGKLPIGIRSPKRVTRQILFERFPFTLHYRVQSDKLTVVAVAHQKRRPGDGTIASVRLPGGDRAQIDPRKLYGYLLSPTHQIGRFKARFFAALGHDAERWRELDADLRAQHLTQDAIPGESLRDGQLFTISAILKGRNGEAAFVRSVWFVPSDGSPPRFVTAYPGGSQ